MAVQRAKTAASVPGQQDLPFPGQGRVGQEAGLPRGQPEFPSSFGLRIFRVLSVQSLETGMLEVSGGGAQTRRPRRAGSCGLTPSSCTCRRVWPGDLTPPLELLSGHLDYRAMAAHRERLLARQKWPPVGPPAPCESLPAPWNGRAGGGLQASPRLPHLRCTSRHPTQTDGTRPVPSSPAPVADSTRPSPPLPHGARTRQQAPWPHGT